LEPLQSVRAGVQEVAYYQAGLSDVDPPQSTAAAADTAQPPFAKLTERPDLASPRRRRLSSLAQVVILGVIPQATAQPD
jgi:hypothetical protein